MYGLVIGLHAEFFLFADLCLSVSWLQTHTVENGGGIIRQGITGRFTCVKTSHNSGNDVGVGVH